MKNLFIVCVFVVFGSGVFGQGIKFIEGEKWDNVLRMAQEQNKYIFMDCYTSWCGPCKALAKDVFTKNEVGNFFNSTFVNVKYDMEKGEGKELYTRYKKFIIGFPTLLLIDKNGNVVHQMAGYQEPEVLIAGMKAGVEGKSLFVMQEKYNAGSRDLGFLNEYVSVLQGAFLKDEIQKVAEDYMKSIPVEDLLKKEVWDFVGEYVKDPYSPQFNFVVFNFDKYVYRLKVDGYRLERQLTWALEKAVKDIVELKTDEQGHLLPLTDEPEKVNMLLTLLNRGNFKRAEEMRAKLKIHTLKLEEKWNDVVTYLLVCRDVRALGYTERFLCESFMYIALHGKDKKVLKRCLPIMEGIQAKEDMEKDGSNYHGTLAELYRALGNKQKAEEHQKIDEQKQKEAEERFRKMFEKKE